MSTSLEAPRMAAETEVTAKATRRRFTAAEKLRVLKEADRCTKPGELGALLRREGLYSSHLSTWRTARQRGELAGLAQRAGAEGQARRPAGPQDHRASPRDLSAPGATRASRGVDRGPKNSLAAPGHLPRGRRAELMRTVAELSPRLGVAPTCAALSVPRASYYRGL